MNASEAYTSPDITIYDGLRRGTDIIEVVVKFL